MQNTKSNILAISSTKTNQVSDEKCMKPAYESRVLNQTVLGNRIKVIPFYSKLFVLSLLMLLTGISPSNALSFESISNNNDFVAPPKKREKVEVDKKTGVITVDGKYYADLEKESAPGQLGINNNFIISVAGEELVYMAFTSYPEKDAFGRKTGKSVTYYTITFKGSGQSSRKNGTMTATGAARLLVKNHLIVDGAIDVEAECKFHLKY